MKLILLNSIANLVMNFDNEQKVHEAIGQTARYRLEKNYRFAVSLTSDNTLPE